MNNRITYPKNWSVDPLLLMTFSTLSVLVLRYGLAHCVQYLYTYH